MGSLPYDVDDDQLREMFEPFGTVTSAKVIVDRDTGRSRGFGFIEMSSSDEGSNAIQELNGKDMGGRAIVVNEARERERSPGGGGGGGRGRGPGRGGGGGRRY